MNKTPLDKNKILGLLTELGNMLMSNNIQSNMYVYGGTVMCLEYGLRCSTFDVDCIYTNDMTRTFAEGLALKYNIQKDWLNNAIIDIVVNDMCKQEVQKTVEIGGLLISIPTPKQMIAMKVYAARLGTSNDLDDAYKLCVMMGIKSSSQIRSVLSEFFKTESIRNRNKVHKNIIGRFIDKLEERLM